MLVNRFDVIVIENGADDLDDFWKVFLWVSSKWVQDPNSWIGVRPSVRPECKSIDATVYAFLYDSG